MMEIFMPKSSREQIDEDERKILFELQKNSNESIDKIARKCGFSRQKVWRLIKRLEKNKTIWGYTAIIDDNKLGVNRYYVLIKKTNVPTTKDIVDTVIRRDLKKKMEDLEIHLECSYFIHGSYDWILCLTASHIKQVKSFIEAFNTLFQNNVSDIQIQEVIFTIEKFGFDNPNKEDFRDFFG